MADKLVALDFYEQWYLTYNKPTFVRDIKGVAHYRHPDFKSDAPLMICKDEPTERNPITWYFTEVMA